MVRIFYGLLTAYIIMLFIVAMLFNIAPITYIVFGIAIVLSLLLQYDWFKKHTLSEKTHVKLICCVFIIFNLCLAGLVADWLKYDTQMTLEQTDGFEFSTMDWQRGWPNDDGLPEGLKRPKNLPEGISRASASGDSLAWANAYPTRYTVLEGNSTVIAQYEEIAKEHAVYQAQIDKDGMLRDLNTGERIPSISHPSEYNIIESIHEETIDLPKRDFIEWLRFAPRKETKTLVNQTTSSVSNHRLYVFVDDGNTKRPHFVELLISNDGTRAVFYQSK